MQHESIKQINPLPPMIRRLLIINGVIWLLTVILRRMGIHGVFDLLALTPSDVFPGFQIWQVFTYMWLHSTTDFFHIAVNSLFLWMFGAKLEQRFGGPVFLRFYLTCGVVAGLVVLIAGLIWNPDIPTVGASGAIYGLVAAWAILFPDMVVYVFGVFPLKGRYFALFPIGYAVLDFIVGGSSGISHAAHLGGLITGAALITGYWRPKKLRNRMQYALLKRRLKVLDGHGRSNKPPGGQYWN